MSRRDKSGSKYTILCMPSQVISLEVPASETQNNNKSMVLSPLIVLRERISS